MGYVGVGHDADYNVNHDTGDTTICSNSTVIDRGLSDLRSKRQRSVRDSNLGRNNSLGIDEVRWRYFPCPTNEIDWMKLEELRDPVIFALTSHQ